MRQCWFQAIWPFERCDQRSNDGNLGAKWLGFLTQSAVGRISRRRIDGSFLHFVLALILATLGGAELSLSNKLFPLSFVLQIRKVNPLYFRKSTKLQGHFCVSAKSRYWQRYSSLLGLYDPPWSRPPGHTGSQLKLTTQHQTQNL